MFKRNGSRLEWSVLKSLESNDKTKVQSLTDPEFFGFVVKVYALKETHGNISSGKKVQLKVLTNYAIGVGSSEIRRGF